MAFKKGIQWGFIERWRTILLPNISTNIMISNVSAKIKARARLRK